VRLLSKPMVLMHHGRVTAGADRRATSRVTPLEVKGMVRHRQFVDEQDGGLVSTVELLVYLPADCPATSGDLLLIDGAEFELPSDPFRAFNPRTGRVSHLEVRARRAER
jgi:hypothetical protein